jgi:cytochrome c-type biogenesis protein CcmH
MIQFWALGALLAAGALLLVLRPLLARRAAHPVSRRAANLAIHRDQRRELDADLAAGKLAPADYEKSRAELEARALEDAEAEADAAPAAEPARSAGRGAALAVGIALPLCALAVYFAVGSPRALDPRAHPGAGPAQIEAMVEGLAARLRENPDNAEGWKMLARSYTVLGRFDEAVDAYAKAVLRVPRDAQLLADFADALAMARGQSLQGEPEKLVLRALAIDPQNLKALALAGTAAFERKEYKAAAGYWQSMLPLVAPESEDARAIRANVAEAEQLAGTVARPGIRGTVRLSPKLKGKVAPGDTVLIYARAAGGPAMPLAVLRRSARELPIEYALDDTMAMAPGMALSAHARVVVTARVSRSGAAKPASGDLQGASKPVANDARGVDILIDTVVP